MRNKIIFPVLGSIWIVITMIAIDMTLINSKVISSNNSSILHEQIDAIILRMCILGVIVSCIVIVILKNIILNITEPIDVLTKDARNCQRGYYKHQLRHYSMDELQNLAYAFDGMGDELRGTIRKLKHQNVKLESMFNSLEEGIIVLDKKGCVDETNELAKRLLGINDVDLQQQNNIVSLIRVDEFIKFIGKGLNSSKSEDIEIKIGDSIVYITMVPVSKEEKIYAYLLLIRDVTRLRSLEELKYQFVTNVSHEIKTPLTSIQGFVETLQSGAIEDTEVARKFLNIIDIESKRLYRLIQDILTLSEIENMNCKQIGKVDISKVISNTIVVLEEQANNKKISIKFQETDKLIALNIKEDHMSQIIMNLLSNAIKYTEEGEIVVKTLKDGEKQIICVSDTGIGIPKESLDHIFERFYRVDKSRSRKNGGTGLGLSIVKHIASLYDINIKVSSEVDKGTIFKLEL